MKRKILLFMLFAFILFGCGNISKIRVLSIGKPYLVGVEELCKKQYEKDINCSSGYFFFPDKEESKTKVIAVPIKTNFSLIQHAGYYIRECSNKSETYQVSKHIESIAFPFDRKNNKRGFFILSINKIKKLGWLNEDNLLIKRLCVSPYLEVRDNDTEIDPIALKKALDELDLQEK